MDLRENRAMELESGIAAFETKNFAHATKLLSPIAEEGNSDAMYRMAIMLQNGLGCLANEDKAFSYMKKAAENGLPLAMHALGFMSHVNPVRPREGARGRRPVASCVRGGACRTSHVRTGKR